MAPLESEGESDRRTIFTASWFFALVFTGSNFGDEQHEESQELVRPTHDYWFCVKDNQSWDTKFPKMINNNPTDRNFQFKELSDIYWKSHCETTLNIKTKSHYNSNNVQKYLRMWNTYPNPDYQEYICARYPAAIANVYIHTYIKYCTYLLVQSNTKHSMLSKILLRTYIV